MAESLLPLGFGIRPFLRWWSSELQGLVPPGWRIGGRRPRLAVSLEPSPVLHRLGGGGAEPLVATDLPAQPVTLWLPDEVLLCLDLDLPIAAEENLRQVLAFEMDRRTPFPAESVQFDHVVVRRDAKAGMLRVRMVAAPRPLVAAALVEARGLGLEVARIEPQGGDPDIDLMPRDAGTAQRQLAEPALQAVAVMLAALAAVLPGERQRLRADALEAELAAVKPAGERAAALRADLQRLDDEARFLAVRKAADPPAVVVLEEATALLPDDTWLIQLRLSGGSLNLVGYSRAATALVPLLADAKPFSDPRFNAPVINDERIGAERFDITVEVRR